ncbi:hypothetical protein KIN20_033870 [Parelaphostrongylus tenuis]|uniref:Uncharacterized protein n=1 Tax=Parelaphostrongylus tenuis TaxID=148309 RepID=A0AAD5WIK8_PARTN|nr:hypothetical protein KIN20_033870 [Parelaphostrongylus tenuis]
MAQSRAARWDNLMNQEKLSVYEDVRRLSSSSDYNSTTPTPADGQQLVAVLRQRTLVDVNDNDCLFLLLLSIPVPL